MNVVIVDYGLGNLYSVSRALMSQGASPTVSDDPHIVAAADRLVLPGVGAFGDGMAGLMSRRLIDPIKEFAATGRPLLGICLGTQLLMDVGREFGEHFGLGLVAGEVVPFDGTAEPREKIPHVGWNRIRPIAGTQRWNEGILAGLQGDPEMYFTHSFLIKTKEPGDVAAIAEYSGQQVCAVIEHQNVHGCQFHPEKSGPTGLEIIGRFLEL